MFDMTFSFGKAEFTIEDLLEKKLKSFKVQQFLDIANSLSNNIYNDFPIVQPDDLPNDSWLFYVAPDLGLTFEFVLEELVYISFELDVLNKENVLLPNFLQNIQYINDLPDESDTRQVSIYYQTVLNKNIVMGALSSEEDENRILQLSFGNATRFKEKDKLPNRYSPVVMSMLRS